MKILLALLLSFSLTGGVTPVQAEIDCDFCKMVWSPLADFGSWVGSYLSFEQKKPTPPPPQCPDTAMGRVAHQKSIGSRYLREVANLGWFDRALQRDPQIRRFLGSDPRLKRAQTGDRNLQACITQGPTLKYLLGLDAGVTEGLDIGEHTATVLDNYLQQRRFYPTISLTGVTDKTLDRFMLPIMALHDIGKGIAVKAGNKELQHHYTGRFVSSYLRSVAFTQKEINVAVALIDHDTVGDFLKDETMPVAEARRKLQQRANLAGMSYGNFMKLQQLFYTADSASYPFLQDLVFRPAANGKLSIKDQRFKQLL